MLGGGRFETTGLLGGLAILILVGTGLSMLTDLRFDYTKTKQNAADSQQENSEKLSELWSNRSRLQDELDRRARQTDLRRKDIARFHQTRREHAPRLPGLRSRAEELAGEVQRLETDFSRYRASYRTEQWRDAAGMQLGSLILLDGRQFRSVAIVRVTADGLDITHEQGRARIPRRELGQAWQDRFQWADSVR